VDGGTVAGSVGWPRRSMLRFWKPMPYKLNEGRRHKFPNARYRVTNWPDYDAALVRRGELTVWLTEEAIAAWHAPATGERGSQPIYSAIAIETALTLRRVFHQPLRQTEGCCDRSRLCSTSILQFSTTRHWAAERVGCHRLRRAEHLGLVRQHLPRCGESLRRLELGPAGTDAVAPADWPTTGPCHQCRRYLDRG